ncbi:hypothetical protein NDU88_006543 [Pleurodeles waltl]|uniref:Uncharacterized protein n=1 Tax=Pleurodeles waltl TaxID=8319 RepID=A0AAV7TYP3_PLEWA|nr:hypothetical protein NDU88_006543 [Pleurodeles waltl]
MLWRGRATKEDGRLSSKLRAAAILVRRRGLLSGRGEHPAWRQSCGLLVKRGPRGGQSRVIQVPRSALRSREEKR